jgi:hypothetical protein
MRNSSAICPEIFCPEFVPNQSQFMTIHAGPPKRGGGVTKLKVNKNGYVDNTVGITPEIEIREN